MFEVTGQISSIFNRFESLSRYVSDLFYMAPIYHQAFTKLGKLLVIDSTDLTIVSDIKVKRVNISEENQLVSGFVGAV